MSFTFPSPSRRWVVQARGRHFCPARHEGHGYRVFHRGLLHVLSSDSVDVLGRHVPLTIFQLNSLFDCCHRNLLSVNRCSDTNGLRWSCRALDQFEAPRLTTSTLGGAVVPVRCNRLLGGNQSMVLADGEEVSQAIIITLNNHNATLGVIGRTEISHRPAPAGALPALRSRSGTVSGPRNPDRMTGPSSRPAPRYRSSTCR